MSIGQSMLARIGASIGASVGVTGSAVDLPTPPAWVAAGTFVGGTTDQTPAPPAHQADDVLYLLIEATAAIAMPGGWTEVADSPQAQSTFTRLHVGRRVATDGSTPTPTVEIGTSNHLYCGIVAVRGADTDTPEDDTAGAASGAAGLATITWPAAVTTGQSRLVLLVASYSIDDAGPIADQFASSTLSLLTERVDGGTTAANGGGLIVATGVCGGTGSIGTPTCRVTATLWAAITIAVSPA